MAGLIDWNAIEDRTRNIDGNTHWTSPASIIRAVAKENAELFWRRSYTTEANHDKIEIPVSVEIPDGECARRMGHIGSDRLTEVP